MLPKMMTHHAVWAKRVRILRLTRFQGKRFVDVGGAALTRTRSTHTHPAPDMSGSVTRTPAVTCDRSELKTGIVHFGVGGFHRSHQQVRLRVVSF